MNLRDRNLRFALLKAVADAINEELTNERTDHTIDLRARYDDEGTTGFDVKLPDGTKVAKISLSIPKPSTDVVDEEAFTAWCRDNFPTAVTEHLIPAQPAVVLPATPARTVHVVDPKLTATLLKDAKVVDGMVFDQNGTLIDGVEYKPAGAPKSFSVRYESDGRDALAVAYRAGELDHLVAGTALPALDSGVTVALPWVSTDDDPVPFVLDEDTDTVIGGHWPECNDGCDETGHLLLADEASGLRASLARGIEESARGETEYLGSFAEYLDEPMTGTFGD